MPGVRVFAVLGPAVCCLLLGLSEGSPATTCSHKINCILQRREPCPPGSTECGPCVQGLEELSNGRCWMPQKAEKVSVPFIDAEIDDLASKIAKVDALQLAEEDNNTSSQTAPPPNVPPRGPSGRSRTPTEHPVEHNTVPRKGTKGPLSDALLLGIVVSCAVAGLMALIVAGICWCRLNKEIKLAEKTDYASYKSSPPPPYEKTSPGDKKLAQSAQMYHYQHQKQQMLSMEKNKDEPKHPDSAVTSDEENEDGDFTVYECPGLAPTGEMEVKNPLFDDSSLHHPVHNSP